MPEQEQEQEQVTALAEAINQLADAILALDPERPDGQVGSWTEARAAVAAARASLAEL